jgi:heme exporter protein C
MAGYALPRQINYLVKRKVFMWRWFHRFAAPEYSYLWCNRLLPWFSLFATAVIIYGLYGGLVLAPADYQQGDGFRIIYVHVPSAFLSLMVYGVMSVAALVSLIWRIKVADLVVIAAVPIGASFTFIALVTGALWGKPMWGAWWVWDARLTSELILLFIYLAVMALNNALQGRNQQSSFRNIFVLVGSLNLPIIHYSVYWWNTLHQGATLSLVGPSHIAPSMARPLIAMIVGFMLLFGVILLLRLRHLILWECRKTKWVQLKILK